MIFLMDPNAAKCQDTAFTLSELGENQPRGRGEGVKTPPLRLGLSHSSFLMPIFPD